MDHGAFIAVTNISAWISYGCDQDPSRQMPLGKLTVSPPSARYTAEFFES